MRRLTLPLLLAGITLPAAPSGAAGPRPAKPTVRGVYLRKSVAPPGGRTTGTVRLTGPAPKGGLRVMLATSDPIVRVPGTVQVPEGARSASFVVRTHRLPLPLDVKVIARRGSVVKSTVLKLRRQARR